MTRLVGSERGWMAGGLRPMASAGTGRAGNTWAVRIHVQSKRATDPLIRARRCIGVAHTRLELVFLP